MSARDDYDIDQLLYLEPEDALEKMLELWLRMCDEIDNLRARSLCGECGGPLVLRCDDCGTVHG